MINSGIYKIANKVTGDFYIGSSVNIRKRFKMHKCYLKNNKHCNLKLQNVHNKYGIEKLSFKIIEYVGNKNNLIIREQYYLDNLYPEYNICKVAGSTLGKKLSEKTKKKISESLKGHIAWNKGKSFSKEIKKKMSKSHLGLKSSEKTKKKLSENQKGINNSFFGKKHTEACKLNLSKPFRFFSPEGKIVKGINLRKFCRENNLAQSNMWRVLNNKLKSCKGWTNGTF